MFTDALPNLLIGLREGLEAGLIVSILVATVVRAGRRHQLTPLWLGVVAAAAISLAFGAVLTFAAADLSTRNQEAIGGILSLVAVGFVTWMVFWMRRSARTLSAELTSRTEQALVLGSRVVVVTAFVAVAREGLESALFLWSTTRTAGESTGPLLGALLGFAIAGGLCFGLYRRALRINLSRFFTWTGAGLIVVAAGVLGYAVAELQEAAILPGGETLAVDLTRHIDPTSWYARLVEGVFNLTPSMSVLRVVAYLTYLVVVLGLFLWAARRVPAPTRPAPAGPTPAAGTEPAVAGGRRRTLLVGAGLVLVPALLVALVVALTGTKDGEPTVAIEVTDHACAPDWQAPDSGRRRFEIDNESSTTIEIYLRSADGRTTYGEVEGLAPGTNRTLEVVVPPGSYRWRCVTVAGAVTHSGTATVTGDQVHGATTSRPVSAAELDAAVARYRTRVGTRLVALVADTDALTAAVRSGDLGPARARWVVAHQSYQRMGAAYGTFGDLDTAIDGRPDGLAGGAGDPSFTGFHRLEHELWHPGTGDPVATADRLDADVHRLQSSFPTLDTDPTDLALRAHEILENTLQLELTGQTDQGSGSNLATARANVDGTFDALDALAPLLRDRDPAGAAGEHRRPARAGRPARRRPPPGRRLDAGRRPDPGPAPAARRGHRRAARGAGPDPRRARAGAGRSGLSVADLSRRRFLGAAAVGGAAGLASAYPLGVARGESLPPADRGRPSIRPFHGDHQAGVVEPPAPEATIASFDVLAADRAELADLLRALTHEARRLTAGGDPADPGTKAPPADNGVLGPLPLPTRR